MAIIIGVVSQKGGVGKSTIARLIAREFAQVFAHVSGIEARFLA